MNALNEDVKKSEFYELRRNRVLEVEELLRSYDYDAQVVLSSFIAALCDVDEAEMLSPTDKLYIAQARWLLWYSYRYLCNDTYARISERTSISGAGFTKDSVRKGCEKISSLIECNKLWKSRWAMVRKLLCILKDSSSCVEENDEKYKLTISLPKELKDKINLEIKPL